MDCPGRRRPSLGDVCGGERDPGPSHRRVRPRQTVRRVVPASTSGGYHGLVRRLPCSPESACGCGRRAWAIERSNPLWRREAWTQGCGHSTRPRQGTSRVNVSERACVWGERRVKPAVRHKPDPYCRARPRPWGRSREQRGPVPTVWVYARRRSGVWGVNLVGG